jgi:hypothetical protein
VNNGVREQQLVTQRGVVDGNVRSKFQARSIEANGRIPARQENAIGGGSFSTTATKEETDKSAVWSLV